VATFESGRRLCLLVEAGDARYAVEATAVTEVASLPPGAETVRGSLPIQDLSTLLGGPAEPSASLVVILDVSPTLALRVRKVVEVADVARDPFFHLPPGMGERLPLLARGAVLHAGRVYLELVPEALPHRPREPVGAPLRPIYLMDEPPDRALVVESQGRLFGLPLVLVSQVITGTEAFCGLPARQGPVAGLYPHGQALWPIFSAHGLLGGTPSREELFVLTELAGQSVGLCAARVLGLHQHFSATEARGEFVAPTLQAPALFLDLQRMFS
jgi:chemotaxis signal transduction protein